MKGEWFAGRLKQLREAAGLTQKELADRAGLTTDGIARLERSDRKPTWETVLALCQALGVSCEEFAREPAERPPRGRGRPPKGVTEGGQATAATPEKQTKGRGRKGRQGNQQ